MVLAENGERRSLGERIADLLGGSEVLAFWAGTWKFVIDQDAAVVTDPVSGGDFTINEEDELEAATLEVTGIEGLPTELSISFRDRDKDGAEDNEAITLADPQPTPRKVERVAFPGVQRRRQVRRVGRLLLQQKRLHTKRIGIVGTFGKGLRLLQLEPGDIVKYTSTRLGFTAKKFRIYEKGWSSDMKPAFLLVEHDPAAYSLPWQGPNSAVVPGARPPPTSTGTTSGGTSLTSSGPPSAGGPPKLVKVRYLRVTRIKSKSKVGDGVG
ncbi:MAG: phage tail protein [Planctomycetota bacterium]